MRFRSLLIAVACLALVVPLATAQTTGSVSGVVKDKDGSPVPGATVTISGPQLPRGQSTNTRSDGAFKFSALLPGSYQLRAELLSEADEPRVLQLGESLPARHSLGRDTGRVRDETDAFPRDRRRVGKEIVDSAEDSCHALGGCSLFSPRTREIT